MAFGQHSQLPSQLDNDLPPVDDRIARISEAIKQDKALRENELPGLAELLDDYLAPDVPVTPEDFMRRLLHVFRFSKDNTYQTLLQKYSESERQVLDAFVTGNPADEAGRHLVHGPSIGTREELQRMQDAPKVVLHHHHLAEAIKEAFSTEERKTEASHMTKSDIGLYENDVPLEVSAIESLRIFTVLQDSPIYNVDQVYEDARFQNWGLTVENKPRYTCVPKTVSGVQQVVKYAKAKEMGVRVSGYREYISPMLNSPTSLGPPGWGSEHR